MAACAQQAFTAAVIEKEKKASSIDQDLHVYCQDCDLFYCVFLQGRSGFTHLSKATSILKQIMS